MLNKIDILNFLISGNFPSAKFHFHFISLTFENYILLNGCGRAYKINSFKFKQVLQGIAFHQVTQHAGFNSSFTNHNKGSKS